MKPLVVLVLTLAAVSTTQAQSQQMGFTKGDWASQVWIQPRIAAAVKSGACGFLMDLKMHPNQTKLIGNDFVTGRIYEIDVATGQYKVLTKMANPHGLLVKSDAFYVTQITAGRVMRYDFATKEVSNAFPSLGFGDPARLLAVDNNTFLVSEPARSRILKVTSADGQQWASSEFSSGMLTPDGVIRGPEGTLLVGAWSPKALGGKIYTVDATTGEVLGNLKIGLDSPTGSVYYKGKIIVSEFGPISQRVSVLVQGASGRWTREHSFGIGEPTGLDVGIDPTTGHATLYAAQFSARKIWKYDLDNGYAKSLLTKLECNGGTHETDILV